MDLEERRRRASGSVEEVASVLFDPAEEVLLALLDNPRLNDDHLKVILSRKNLGRKILRELGGRERLLRSYQVKLALLRHSHTPRSVSLALLRHVYLFDLVKVAGTPSAAPDIRRAAEESVLARLPALALGERLSLARQGSARIACGLVADPHPRVYSAALQNPRLTEDGVIRALGSQRITPEAVEAIATHLRWSLRYDVRLAIIRHPASSLRRMLSLLDTVGRRDLADVAGDPRMAADRRHYLAELVRRRKSRESRKENPVRPGSPARRGPLSPEKGKLSPDRRGADSVSDQALS